MPEQVTPNETTKNLEEARKASLRKAVTGKDGNENEEEVKDSQEKTEKSEKKLDNDQKNSYINNKDKDSSEDTSKSEEGQEDIDEFEKVLNDTFGGDPKKAVKSWKEASKNYTKLRNEYKEDKQKLDALDNLAEKNPLFAKIVKTTAEKGELTEQDLQNFLNAGDREPNGKPSKTSSESKLEVVDEDFSVSDIDEETLIKSDYLDADKKESMSPSDWSTLKRQAALRYAEDQLPKKLANKAYQEFQRQIDQEEKKREQEKTRQKNQEVIQERYEQGVDRVIDEFGLDFAGNPEHEELLDEIESLAVNIRDPKNDAVIHPNAIYLATVEVLKEKDINPQPTNVDEKVNKAEQKVDDSFDKRTGFNANTKEAGNNQPKTLADKLKQRHLSEYEEERQKRIKTGRISGDS